MDKNSTPVSKDIPAGTTGPKIKTLDFIRQFARIYMPVSDMEGVILN